LGDVKWDDFPCINHWKKNQRYWILNRKLETSKEEDKTQRGSIGSIVLAEIEFRNPFVWRRHHCSVFGPEAPSTFVS
jgi:pyruvate/2-oxoacid:ferredoxin oxidoreductase beta subunit